MPDAVVHNIQLLKGIQGRAVTREAVSISLVNNSGGPLVYGNIVILDPSAERSVKLATAVGEENPLIVLLGGEVGETIKCFAPGSGIAIITCNGPAIVPGDMIITSATPTYGKALEGEETTGGVGVALTAKLAAITAQVAVIAGGGIGGAAGPGAIIVIAEGVTGRVVQVGNTYTIDSRAVVGDVPPLAPWDGMIWVDPS